LGVSEAAEVTLHFLFTDGQAIGASIYSAKDATTLLGDNNSTAAVAMLGHILLLLAAMALLHCTYFKGSRFPGTEAAEFALNISRILDL